ncbi:hypothetical protein E3N88_15213 [Mikania micrantha]|uniref:Uncharacterized protein n=1 Tax=Mikania micrantha TaxID=192012 RepID=A0A5N6NX23_9ASTR|nr:hypothetical protein E3N88_15213 [Mikania micrantha]
MSCLNIPENTNSAHVRQQILVIPLYNTSTPLLPLKNPRYYSQDQTDIYLVLGRRLRPSSGQARDKQQPIAAVCRLPLVKKRTAAATAVVDPPQRNRPPGTTFSIAAPSWTGYLTVRKVLSKL